MAAPSPLKDLLDRGQLGPAIDWAGSTLRDRPTDGDLRRVLVTLLSYSGDHARACKQLDALLRQVASDPATLAWVQHDRSLIECEVARSRLYAEGDRPRFLHEVPAHVAARLDALDALRQGDPGRARSLLDDAAADPPAVSGAGPQGPFEGIRDADDILAPVLEVFAPGGYFWLPWEAIQFLEVAPPKTLRDLIWAPAKLATYDGEIGEVHLPSLYPLTASSSDDALRLGRATDWLDLGEGLVRGVGRKLLLLGEDDLSLLDIGTLQFQ